jgi:hypothetical protein
VRRLLSCLIFCLLAVRSWAVPLTADMLVDFEASTDGTVMTNAILLSSTHGTIGNGWATISDPDNDTPGATPNITISTAASFPLYTPITVGGTTYSSSGTRGMRAVLAVGGENCVAITFTSPTNPDSIGFNFRFNGANINTSPRDIVGMRSDPTGGFQFLQIYDGTTPNFRAHWQPPFTGVSAGTNFVRGRWYWVTMQHVSGGNNFRVRFYDTTTGYTLTGEESGAVTTTTVGMTRLKFGGIKYNAGATQSIDFDNIIINTTNGAFPLGPGDGPSASGPYWVSSNGAASWASAQSQTALSGTACASLSTMNSNATAGDTVYLRGGTYTGTAINLTHDGTSPSPIIIEAYLTETVTLSNFADADPPAINLTNRDYVTFRRINTDDCQESVAMSNCTHLRFEDCSWVNHKNTQSGWPVAVRIRDSSQFNVFEECTAGSCGYDSGGDDAGGVMELGTFDSETDLTRYNYFHTCTMFRGGHEVISDYASFNFFDGCFFYSDDWFGSQPYGSRVFITQAGTGDAPPFHGCDTFRDCLFQRAGDPPDALGTAAMSLRTPRNRIIRCIFVDASNAGVNCTSVDGKDNRIGNCVFVRNGVNTTMTDTDQKAALTFLDDGTGDPSGNKITNNILYQNITDAGYEGMTNFQTWSNNWLAANGNPQFVNWSSSDLSPSNRTAHDFHLTNGSGAINNGAWLTTANGTGSSSTSLVVNDSYWFTSGEGIAPGDVIQLQGSTTQLTVTAVNYSTHTLTITPATTWTNGVGVAFPYNSTQPDQGAFEFSDTTPPAVSTVTVASNGITVTFGMSEISTATGAPPTLTMSGGALTLTYSSGSGSTSLVYSASRTIYANETGTASYTQPGNGIEDANGNDLSTFSGASVTNNSTQAVPPRPNRNKSKINRGAVRIFSR